VEEFGMHLNVDGTIIYGLKIDAIDDKIATNISVDKLSRMLVSDGRGCLHTSPDD
jgi:hypothetical protein